jgi:hypothetical protein
MNRGRISTGNIKRHLKASLDSSKNDSAVIHIGITFRTPLESHLVKLYYFKKLYNPTKRRDDAVRWQ